MYDSNTIITFCATIRNCGKFLPSIFQNIDRVSSEWIIKCIFVYDNCSDNTQELLVDYKNKSNNDISQNKIYPIENNDIIIRTMSTCVFEIFKNSNMIIYKRCLYFIFNFILNIMNYKIS